MSLSSWQTEQSEGVEVAGEAGSLLENQPPDGPEGTSSGAPGCIDCLLQVPPETPVGVQVFPPFHLKIGGEISS